MVARQTPAAVYLAMSRNHKNIKHIQPVKLFQYWRSNCIPIYIWKTADQLILQLKKLKKKNRCSRSFLTLLLSKWETFSIYCASRKWSGLGHSVFRRKKSDRPRSLTIRVWENIVPPEKPPGSRSFPTASGGDTSALYEFVGAIVSMKLLPLICHSTWCDNNIYFNKITPPAAD